jgi:hypothetical protein
MYVFVSLDVVTPYTSRGEVSSLSSKGQNTSCRVPPDHRHLPNKVDVYTTVVFFPIPRIIFDFAASNLQVPLS